MKEQKYDPFQDPEFKADCERDQIMWERNICSSCGVQWDSPLEKLNCSCDEFDELG